MGGGEGKPPWENRIRKAYGHGVLAGRNRRGLTEHWEHNALGNDCGDDRNKFARSLLWACAAIALDFFSEGVSRSRNEPLLLKKLWRVCDGENARNTATPRFESCEFDQIRAQAFAAAFRADGDRPNFRKVCAVTFERKTTDDLPFFF
jgi:hypothetical protein